MLIFQTAKPPTTLEPRYLGEDWLLVCESYIPSPLWKNLHSKGYIQIKKGTQENYFYEFRGILELISSGQKVSIDGVPCENTSNIAEKVLQTAWSEYFQYLKLKKEWMDKKNQLEKQFIQLLQDGQNLGVDTQTIKPKDIKWPEGATLIAHSDWYAVNNSYVYKIEYIEPNYESFYPVPIIRYPLTSDIYKIIMQLEAHKKQELPNIDAEIREAFSTAF